MKKRFVPALSLAALVAVFAGGLQAEPVKSGPQAGQKVPGPFRPYNVTGPDAGKRACLYCKNGANPVAMIFARTVNAPVVKFIKKIDAATAAHRDKSMGSCVVFLTDTAGMVDALKQVAEKEQVRTTVLAVDAPAGPASYQIARDADVTVLLYTNRTVKANHAFRAGELNDEAADAILADLARILAAE